MLIIEGKECENIDKALKKYKRKYDRSRILNELRDRKAYTKPSVLKRKQMIKAVYSQKIQEGAIEPKRRR